MSRVKLYIDGFNLYHAIDRIEDSRLKWISYHTLAQSLLRQNEQLVGISFFTAVWRYDQAKQQRHQNFIAAQRHYGVVVHEGNFTTPNKYCNGQARFCSFREEKQTDVGIAVEIVKDVIGGTVDRVVLITADSDQIPTARLLASLPNISRTLYAPPNRAAEAKELGKFFSDKKELTVGRLLTCQMPRTIYGLNGAVVATKPAIYG